MGRFYKTTSANPMEYMHRLPAEMMLGVLNNTETQIDNIYQQSDLLNSELSKIKYLTPDKQRVDDINKSYTQEIDNITKALSEDVTQWRKYQPNIKDLSRKLSRDFTSGEISKIQSNYNSYSEYDKYIAEKEKDGKINPMTGNKFRAKSLEQFSGTSYDSRTGVASSFKGEKPMDDIDLNKWMDEQLKGLKDDGKVKLNAKTGQYIIETENGWEGITQDKILGVLSKSIGGSPELMQYLNQRQRFGVLNNIFDENGALNLATVDKEGKMEFKNNALTSAIQGAMKEHSWIKTKDGIKNITANPYGIQANNQNHDRVMASIKHRYDMQNSAQGLSDAMTLAAFKSELDRKSSDYIDKLDKDNFIFKEQNKVRLDDNGNLITLPTPKKTIINGKVSVNPFAGDGLVDKEKLGEQRISLVKSIGEITSARDKFKKGSNEYMKYNDDLKSLNAQLSTLNSTWDAGYNTAKSKLNSNDYNFFTTMRDGGLDETKDKIGVLQRKIESVKKSMKDPSFYNKPTSETIYDGKNFRVVTKGTPTEELYRLQSELSQEQGKLTKFSKLSSTFNTNMNNIITTNYKAKNFTRDVIKLGDKEQEYAYTSFENGVRNSDIIDPQNGSIVKNKIGGEMLTFEGDGDNIFKYIKDNGKTLKDVMTIQGLSTGTSLGDGTQMVVRFNLPGVNPNKDYLVDLDSKVESSIATQIDSDDPNVNILKNRMLNGLKTSFNTQVQSMYNDFLANPGQISNEMNMVIDNPYQNSVVSLKIKPIKVSGDKFMYKVEQEDLNTGVTTPIGGNAVDGLFLNIEDISDYLYGD